MKMKRFFHFILAFALIFNLAPAMALAVNAETLPAEEEEIICCGATLEETQDTLFAAPQATSNETYVEVNLSTQTLHLFKEGECILSTPIVSGCVSCGTKTILGEYYIYSKSMYVTLTGPGYASPVTYWMPFSGGYGLHDANWRSEFGGEIYLRDGSHGCVNIPPSVAGQVYNNVSVGTKVVIHGGANSLKERPLNLSTETTSYQLTPDASPFRLDVTYLGTPVLNYTSSNPAVAQVSSTGIVTVKGVGTTVITVDAPAHGNYLADSLTVTITVAYDCSQGHDLTWTVTTPPSCVPGEKRGVCPCGYRETQPVAPVQGHSYTDSCDAICNVCLYERIAPHPVTDPATMLCSTCNAVVSGWIRIDGIWYYSDAGVALTGWEFIEGSWYYFDSEGKMAVSTWIGEYMITSTGAMAVGWGKDTDGTWYYFNSNGNRLTGWRRIDNNWYFFQADGKMVCNGWFNGYYFLASGKMADGWTYMDGNWYYFNADGIMQYGWKRISGEWYYFQADGKMVCNTWHLGYYFRPSGEMADGWAQISGEWYYFDANGTMMRGWQRIGNVWYYMNAEGKMLHDTWQGNYYLKSSGEMAVGWLKLGENWYYMDAEGACVTGWKTINSVRYYFDPTTAIMATGRVQIGYYTYYFNNDGSFRY